MSDSLVVPVDADPGTVLAVVDRNVAAEPFAGVEVVARDPSSRIFGLDWRPRPGVDVRIVWDVRVEATDDGCLLSSTRCVIGPDDVLRASRRQIHASADLIARTSLRAIKRAAEARAVLQPVS